MGNEDCIAINLFIDSSWEFRLEDHDIKFGVVRKTNDNIETEVVPIRRITANKQQEEVGLVTCDDLASCKLCKKIFLILIGLMIIFFFFLLYR